MELTLDQALQKGVEAHKAGQVQEADRLYTAILKAQPKHPDANHNMGVLAVGVGKVQEALPFFKTALDANPNTAQFWLSSIDALIKLERLADAKTVLDQAKSNGAKGDGFDTMEQRLKEAGQSRALDTAVQLRDSGEFNQAIDLLEDETNQFPEDADILALLSHCYLLADQVVEAKLYLDKAKKVAPDNASVGWNTARLTLKEKNPLEALNVARDTSQKFPDDVEGMGVLGACLRANNEVVESLEVLNRAVELNPDYAEALINRGLIRLSQENNPEALADLEQAYWLKPHIRQIWDLVVGLKEEAQEYSDAIVLLIDMIEIDPEDEERLATLALCYQHLEDFEASEEAYKKALAIKPDYAKAHMNLGSALREQGKLEEAIEACNKALTIKPDYAEAYNNMGIALQAQGKLEESIEAYNKALVIKPDYAPAYNNMGNALQEQGKLEETIEAYNKALTFKPDYAEALWNLSGTSENISEAKNWVEQCLKADPSHQWAKLSLSALQFYEGDKSEFNALMQSSLKDSPWMRSFAWAFELPELPELLFHRWALFDRMIELSKKARPFYEYGVWRGEAFQYLIKTFKKGYGFDTFEGIPEDWHDEKAGTYSSDGNIPQIEGGEFIVGKFEDTLPGFFSKPRPKASIINFDADLYSSTICALNFSKPVIDKHTILIFDEFIANATWEQDEYKALNEFCFNNNYTYEVLAISFFTKQAAVRLIGI